ncbi:hypothetical protein LGT39_05460 [Demequina sp. TTPB684]|uniref:DUF5677 domain-containing protein n=1 Tax=unclassified Demequina TaxID=2620311 RepID=UPI001CF3146A|nr:MULTISPECIES: DUF5677 domain-containing protein [unclassified Demequina]MCB2412294.1 hypothetical protein [Demequina sp. TTPB684]UPU87574.1 hypothetical protein LGT36_009930 [Demequina sp. TMPB413]
MSDDSVEVPVLDQTITSGFVHLAWAHHAVRISESVDALYERAMYLQAVPLIRQTLETAITSLWAANVSQAGERAYVAHLLSRRTMLREMGGLGMPVSDGLAELATEIAQREAMHGKLDKFKMPLLSNRATAVRGGRDLYVHYRHLSELAHPTFWLADGYAHPVDLPDSRFALSDSSRYDGAPLALNYQLVSVCHTLGIWSTLPHQSDRYQSLLATLDDVGREFDFSVARHPEGSGS